MTARKHGDIGEAKTVFVDGFEKATEAGRWMAAAWEVRDGMVTMVQCTTWDFPTGDFDAAAEQLRKFCDAEKGAAGPMLPTEPLPMANFFRPPGGNQGGKVVDAPLIEMPESTPDEPRPCPCSPVRPICRKPEAPPNQDLREGSIPPHQLD